MDREALKNKIKEIILNNKKTWSEEEIAWAKVIDFYLADDDVERIDYELDKYGYAETPAFTDESFEWNWDERIYEKLKEEGIEADMDEVIEIRMELEQEDYKNFSQYGFWKEVAKEINEEYEAYLKALFPECEINYWAGKKAFVLEKK